MKTKMNVSLLQQIRASILEEPRRLDMDTWVERSSSAPCGTISCIAGHAVLIDMLNRADKTFRNKMFLADNLPLLGEISGKARKLLGLASTQRDKLFFVRYWPDKFREQYSDVMNYNMFAEELKKPARAQLAKITAQRINHFIKTKGRS